jgi:hypothetical protein
MAIKIIQLEEDETFEDLVIEIEIMSKCHHDNIVGYFGSWRKNDELFVRRLHDSSREGTQKGGLLFFSS